MKEIPLTQGKSALIDDHNFEKVSKFKWCAHRAPNTTYAVRNFKNPKTGKWSTISMHRFLSGEEDPKINVYHVDGNGLNNQDHNLRLCNHGQNLYNSGVSKNNTTGFKGVTFDKKRNKWIAMIGVNGRKINLGRFASKEDAARAWDAAALDYHKDFARLNFPNDSVKSI